MLYASGEARAAINMLIGHINSTNGYCDPKIWLALLDIYMIQGQQAAYEKLAVFFSNRFEFSPPAWDQGETKPAQSGGSWRNSLVIEGSPLLVSEQKIRDFILASKEAKTARLDISRMRIQEEKPGEKNEAQQELARLLTIMQRLRRGQAKTLLMGDGQLLGWVKKRCDAKNNSMDSEQIYWMVLLELFQWRGKEQEFDQTALDFATVFSYCPVGYDPSGAVAIAPEQKDEGHVEVDGFVPATHVHQIHDLVDFAQNQWRQNSPAEINLKLVTRVDVEAARELADVLQTETHPDGISAKDIVFHETSEIISALFDATGVSAYATVLHRHEKLRNLLQKAAQSS